MKIVVGVQERHSERPWARAWSNTETRTIYCRSLRPSRRLVAHEVDHILSQTSNERHKGHGLHFCVRSWHALRFWDGHVTPTTLSIADALIKTGTFDET